jgi:hypothetical protein
MQTRSHRYFAGILVLLPTTPVHGDKWGKDNPIFVMQRHIFKLHLSLCVITSVNCLLTMNKKNRKKRSERIVPLTL